MSNINICRETVAMITDVAKEFNLLLTIYITKTVMHNDYKCIFFDKTNAK